jgi:hypothetical protein
MHADLWVISGLCNEGYVLEGVYFARANVFVVMAGRSFGNPSQKYQLSVCRRCSEHDCSSRGQKTKPSVVLRVGHDNYAHFMWNGLPALTLCEQHRSHHALRSLPSTSRSRRSNRCGAFRRRRS